MRPFLAVSLFLCTSSLADSATQTNWSDGSGVPGPVTYFGNTYMSSDSGISVSAFPGQITLTLVAPGIYSEFGILESSILDTQMAEPLWSYLFFSYETPTGTTIGIQLRASDDYTQMGPWSDVLTEPENLIGLLDDSASYLQYRVILATSIPDVTPRLKDITITYPRMVIEETNPPSDFELLPISPSPAAGPAEAIIGLSSSASMEVIVFDLAGRPVWESMPADYQPGWHSVPLGDHPPGVYFVRVRAGEFEATERFVVIE